MVNAFSTHAFQVFDFVQPQQGMVGQEVVALQDEQRVSSDSELLLQLDQGTSVLVVLSEVVQQGDNLLAVDCRLYRLVASVE